MALTLNGYKNPNHAADYQPQLLAEDYMDRVFYACQQKEFKLQGHVTPYQVSPGVRETRIPIWNKVDGETGYSDTITNNMVSAIAATEGTNIREVTSRYAETRNEYLTSKYRRVTTQPWNYAPFVERKDLELMIGQMISSIVDQAEFRYNRKKDKIIINALDATVQEITAANNSSYTETETSVTFPTGQIIDSGGADILTDEKLELAYEKFYENDCDIEMELPVLLIGPKQATNLRGQENQINYDYVSNRAREHVGLPTLPNGIPVIISTQLNTTDNVTDCFLFQPSAIIHAVEEDMYRSFDQLPTRRYGYQFYFEHCSGAIRVIDEKVVKIQCSEAAVA